jgi:uncharacterized protein (AIM24 family)
MFKRALSGESLFVVDYYVDRGEGEVAFSAEFPGKILDLDLADGQSVIVQKDSFLCAEKSVDLDLHFQKRLGAGLFGGEGFMLQRLTGPGRAFVNFDGEILVKDGTFLRADANDIMDRADRALNKLWAIAAGRGLLKRWPRAAAGR